MKLRWIIALTIAVLVLSWLAIIVVVRQINLRALERDRAVMVAAGLAISWEEVDLPPEMDPAVEAIWEKWVAKGVKFDEPKELKKWLAHPSDPVPEVVRLAVDTGDTDLSAVLGLLDTDALRVGIRSQMTRFLREKIDPRLGMDLAESWLTIRALTQYLRCAACISAEPLTSLQRLDHLISATAQPLCLLDSMMRQSVMAVRDDTWLDCIRLGTVTEQQALTWLDMQTDTLPDVASAFMGDRLCMAADFELLADSGSPSSGSASTSSASASATWLERTSAAISFFLPTTQWQWAVFPAGIIHNEWLFANNENIARHYTPLPASSGIGGAGSAIAISIPNIFECNIVCIESGNTARIKRAAARVLFATQRGQSVPMDAAEFSVRFATDIVAAGPGRLALLYTRLSDGGFSLAADLSGPPTLFGMPRRYNSLAFTAAEISAIVARSGPQP